MALSKRWIDAVRSHKLLSGLVLVAVAAALLAVVVQPWSGRDTSAQYTAGNLESGLVKGFLHRPVDQPAAPFTLTDQNGRGATLEDFRGKWLVVTWLYTSCVDTCPLLTYNMKLVQAGLGDRLGNQVQLITFTFDWEHDTVGKMKSYSQLAGADVPGWSWLTGTKEQTDAVAEAYGVAFAPVIHDDGDDHGGVAFDHTALTVVIDPQGIERHRYFGIGWSQDLLDGLNQQLLISESNVEAPVQESVGESPVDGLAPGGLATDGVELETLRAGSTVFTWEQWELPQGVSSQAMYQFPDNEGASTYSQGLLRQVADAGWETVEVVTESDDGPTDAQWVILRDDKGWAAVGGNKNINLVFEIAGNDEDAVFEAIAAIEGTNLCCF